MLEMSELNELRKNIGRSVEYHLRKYEYPKRISQARLDDKLFRDPIFGFQRLLSYEVPCGWQDCCFGTHPRGTPPGERGIFLPEP